MVVGRISKNSEEVQREFQAQRLEYFDYVSVNFVEYKTTTRVIVNKAFRDPEAECILLAITRGSKGETLAIVL